MYILYSIYFIIYISTTALVSNQLSHECCDKKAVSSPPWWWLSLELWHWKPIKIDSNGRHFYLHIWGFFEMRGPKLPTKSKLLFNIVHINAGTNCWKGKPHHFQNLAWLTLSLHHSLEQRPPYAVINIAAAASDVVTGELMSLLTSERVSALGSAVRLRDTYGYVLSNFGWRFIDEGRYQKGIKAATPLLQSQQFKRGLRDAFSILEELAPEATLLGGQSVQS